MVCTVCKRMCKRKLCAKSYSGEQDSIFFWSKETAIGDEVGYLFINKVMTMACSFSSFCQFMTNSYKLIDPQSAPFCSAKTFLKWFFSWAAVSQDDFRNDVDPFCKHDPSMLACDGTHVGVSLRNLDINPMEAPEQAQEPIVTNHTRYDRTFITKSQDLPPAVVREARLYLKHHTSPEGFQISHTNAFDPDRIVLFSVLPEESKPFVCGILDKTYPDDVLSAGADVLNILSQDNPVSALLPLRCVQPVRDICQTMLQGGSMVEDLRFCPEISLLLRSAENLPDSHKREILFFVHNLCQFVNSIFENDPPPLPSSPIAGSYNPAKGYFYYFTPSGEQVRDVQSYPKDERREGCQKVYPKVGKGGFCYVFLWFCPIHGHVYGAHLINGSEGRKDPFSSLFKFAPKAPNVIFYDFACSFNEYSLNREPSFFKNVLFFHDIFHQYNHVCAKTFRSKRIEGLSVNTSICEQFNSFLKSIKNTGSHLSQERFMFLLQFMTRIWNARKTKLVEKSLALVERVYQ